MAAKKKSPSPAPAPAKKSTKKTAPDTVEARQNAQLKQVASFFSGRGGGSADAGAGGSEQRIAKVKSEMQAEMRKGSGDVKKTSTPAPKSSSTPKTQSTKSSTVGNIVGGGAAVVAGGAAAAAAGRAAGRAASRPATVHGSSGPVFRLDERTVGSERTRRTGRDAYGQAMPRGGGNRTSTSVSRVSTGAGRTGFRQSVFKLFR